MKRVIAFISIVSLLMLFPAFCSADSPVNIDSLGFSLSVPSDWYTFTQDTSDSASVWNDFDVDHAAFIDYLVSNNIYLNSISPDFSCEIVLIGRQGPSYTDLYNLSLYNDNTIKKELETSFSDTAEKLGLTIDSNSIYSTENYKFFCFSGKQKTDDQPISIKSYVTIVNGIFVQVSIRSYSDSLSRQQEDTIKRVVDSIHFAKILNKPTAASSKTRSDTLYKALIGGLSAIIIAIPSVIIRSAKRKKSSEEDSFRASETKDTGVAEIETEPISPTSESETKGTFPAIEQHQDNISVQKQQKDASDIVTHYMFCRKCGAKILSDSKFCQECGEKIEKL